MPMQILVRKMTRDEVKGVIAKLNAAEVLVIGDTPGQGKATCLVSAKTKMNAPPNERTQVMGLLQKIADADAKLVQAAAAERQAKRKADADAANASDVEVTP